MSEVMGTRPDNSGVNRGLRASVLDRFPPDDRSTLAFPREIVSFFFEQSETVEVVPAGKEE